MVPTFDPWKRAIETFLADLTGPASGRPAVGLGDNARPIPSELDDLPEAASRVMARLVRGGDDIVARYPSVNRALHEVVIAEVLADRLDRKTGAPLDLDLLVDTMAATLDYFAELAVTSIEGEPVTHGVVISADTQGMAPAEGAVVYPGRLPTRKRTPLLFDGTQSTLVVDVRGHVVRGVERTTLPAIESSSAILRAFDELPGIDGGLTAAASASLRGIGIYLRANRSIVVFDEGTLLFVRRGLRWRSIAFESFTTTVATLGATTMAIGQRVARAALRLSMQGHGAILAIAGDPAALEGVTRPTDRAMSRRGQKGVSVDDDLAHMVGLSAVESASELARLARLDGATVIDTAGNVIAYGAIVRSGHSQAEGARSAAARTLSTAVEIAISVSHDGPITVYRRGAPVLELL